MMGVLCLLVGGVIGGFIVKWANRDALERAKRCDGLTSENEQLKNELTAVKTQLQERQKLYDGLDERLSEKFKSISDSLFKENTQKITEAAQASIKPFQDAANKSYEHQKNDLTEQQKAIAKDLKDFGEKLTKIAEHHNTTSGKVENQLEQLSKETQQLSHAFSDSRQRGRWGELQLERLLEYSGLQKGIHYECQASVTGDDGSFRPDIIVHLSDQRSVAIDAKTPQWDNFGSENVPTSDEVSRKEMAKHVKDLIDQLSAKDYQKHVDKSIDCLILFLPGEWILRDAILGDPQLLDYSCAKNIMLASPVTLMSLLKAIHYGWKQNEMIREIQTIAKLGGELYDRICTWQQHLKTIGDGLSKALNGYNDAIGSLERMVLPPAQKLQICSKKNKEMPLLKPIEAPMKQPLLDVNREGRLPLSDSGDSSEN
ncbi:MAG: DNA recombination protein RmuC [Opitutales bacterium]|nr:DNA recombination protein RmuC [Opitutales bacterium]